MEQNTIELGGVKFKKPKGITAFLLDRLRNRFGISGDEFLKNEFFQTLGNDFGKMCEFFACILYPVDTAKGPQTIDEIKDFLYNEVDVRDMSGALTDFFGASRKK